MNLEPYLYLTGHCLLFCFWSSFWPRRFVKARLEPVLGFRTYRTLYVIGTLVLFGNTLIYLVQHSGETVQLWNFTAVPGYRYILYAFGTLGIVFLSGILSLGPSFWGLADPPPEGGLLTTAYYKVSRHPLYWAVFFFMFGHVLRLGSGLAVLWLVILDVYNVLAVIYLENPGLEEKYGEEWRAFRDRISPIPFVSLLRGKVRIEKGELPTGRLIGAGVFTLFVVFWFHDVLVWLCYYLPPIGTVSEKVVSEWHRIFG